MRIFIRTTGERTLEQFKDLKYDILLDKERTGCKGYFKQLKYLSEIDDDILLLEDDILLKKFFFSCLESLILISNNQYIINMSQPTSSLKCFNPKDFMWTRAVYYPKNSIKEFMNNYDESCLDISKYYDKIQGTLMLKTYIGVPSIMNIVDLDLPSLMNYK